ncbi:TetR/AcrR family transcriptional regulator [Acidimangrovimonas sediminis]|uniref:TetR/AcrR family transcriptional regulator n=1 Tax=Acidimangrovimonas sediminis TaxID=2056283 RepID=UPI000C802E15|nr:TetR/AcrR family transcriptional regulator [Acidimangrovimonas sediminis]
MNVASKIKRGRKFDQVLAGARVIFLRDGFEGASVDDIAREAGVSKATLYSYFPDKRLLFMEVAKAECRRQAESAAEFDDEGASPRKVLTIAGRRIGDLAMSDMGRGVFRICLAEADRFPEIGREFYESGPLLVRNRLCDYLQRAMDRGQLEIEDVPLAAEQFSELCKADIQVRRLFKQDETCSAQKRNKIVKSAVDMFLARYATEETKIADAAETA